MSKKVLVPMGNGFEETEAVAMIDVMRRAGLEVTIAAVGDECTLTGANGIVLVADATLAQVEDGSFDFIALPGGHENALSLSSDPRIQAMLKAHAASGKPLGAICAAPTALHAAGLIQGAYTCYPGYEGQIDPAHLVTDQQVVINGNIITSRGPGTALCFALAIVRLLVGEETAKQLQTGMLIGACA